MAQAEIVAARPSSSFGKKTPWTIYTVFLALSLAAVVLSLVYLYLEIRQFGDLFSFKGP